MVFSGAVRKDRHDQLIREYGQTLARMDLKHLVRELFTYLDCQEESESGKMFHPVVIRSCRCLMSEPLNELLKRLRDASR